MVLSSGVLYGLVGSGVQFNLLFNGASCPAKSRQIHFQNMDLLLLERESGFGNLRIYCHFLYSFALTLKSIPRNQMMEWDTYKVRFSRFIEDI